MPQQVSNQDELIPFTAVPKMKIIPRRRGGSRLAVATLYRWWKTGIGGVHLRVSYVGSQPCTCAAWLTQFFEQVAAAKSKLNPETSSAAQDRVERQLRAAGAM
jgi:hypothetical protein